MKVFIPKADVNLGMDKLTGKDYFCCRLSCALRLLGMEVTGNSKDKTDISLNIIRLVDSNSRVKLLRLAGIWHDTGKSYQQKNIPLAISRSRCDGIVYQTQFTEAMCNKYLGKCVKPKKVIFNGADPEFYKNVIPVNLGGKKIVMAFSRWRPHKRLRDIIESFLLADAKDAVLFVAGDLSLSGLAEEEQSRFFGLPNVKYLGILNQNDLWSYLKVASASIHLSWIDWCPNSVVEALVAKIPVISNNVGGVRELVLPSGSFVCDIDRPYNMDPVDLYHPPAIDRRVVAEKIELCCRQRIEVKNDHVLIQNIAKQYLEFMQELVDKV